MLRDLPEPIVLREAEVLLLDLMDRAWSHGWQPAEVHRQAKLDSTTAAGARLVAAAIAADHIDRRSTTLDARWVAQVESLPLPEVRRPDGWATRWAAEEGLDHIHAIDALVEAVGNVASLPVLRFVLPPPGSDGSPPGAPAGSRSDGVTGAESDPLLNRIRGLLAKAESTSFEAEAAAFTAKAQELMTRHAIDAAMVDPADRKSDERPVAVRVMIDAPYLDAKSLLLQTVAGAGRCRTIYHHGLAMSTIVGFADDVVAVEMLFTSLLVQAQTALAEAAKHAAAGTRTRSQSYRSAFLFAYTERIGQRLHEINDSVIAEAEAEHGSSFLPVLRSRDDNVDDFVAEQFGELLSSPVRGSFDPAGRASGKVAADNAHLAHGTLSDPVG
jgi:hypothetical protein